MLGDELVVGRRAGWHASGACRGCWGSRAALVGCRSGLLPSRAGRVKVGSWGKGACPHTAHATPVPLCSPAPQQRARDGTGTSTPSPAARGAFTSISRHVHAHTAPQRALASGSGLAREVMRAAHAQLGRSQAAAPNASPASLRGARGSRWPLSSGAAARHDVQAAALVGAAGSACSRTPIAAGDARAARRFESGRRASRLRAASVDGPASLASEDELLTELEGPVLVGGWQGPGDTASSAAAACAAEPLPLLPGRRSCPGAAAPPGAPLPRSDRPPADCAPAGCPPLPATPELCCLLPSPGVVQERSAPG